MAREKIIPGPRAEKVFRQGSQVTKRPAPIAVPTTPPPESEMVFGDTRKDETLDPYVVARAVANAKLYSRLNNYSLLFVLLSLACMILSAYQVVTSYGVFGAGFLVSGMILWCTKHVHQAVTGYVES